MKNLKIIFLSIVLLASACSTDNFQELNTDPNRPTSAPAALVLKGVLVDLYEAPWSLVHRWNQYWCCNYNYYGNQEYNWTTDNFNFFTLKNSQKMVEESKKADPSASNPYTAIDKFLKAYFAYRMTMKFGDIPFTEALQGAELTTPKYDNQKQVFAQILTLLDDANTEFGTLIAAGKKTLDGDIYLNSDLTKWQKVNNAFKMRVLIQLSKKVGEADLKIKERFAEVLSNPAKFPLLRVCSKTTKTLFYSILMLRKQQIDASKTNRA